MKIGGYSHLNGVTFFCDMFKIRGSRKKGSINYDMEWIVPPKWLRKLENKFILGSLSIAYYQWKVLSRYIRILLLALVTLYMLSYIIDISFLDKYLYHFGKKIILPLAIILLILLIFNYKKIIRVFKYHGAEHKVINCYIENGYVDLHSAKKESRFNKRCGSNIAGIFLLLYIPILIFNIDSLIFTFIVFLIAIQITKLFVLKDFSWDKYVQVLQWVTVLEPEEEELEVAVATFNQLQKAYYLYEIETNKNRNKT